MSEWRSDPIEPWQPQEGDYVRIVRGPECQSWHSQRGDEPATGYGRIEIVDRTYDDPEKWAAALVEDDTVPTPESEARQIARDHFGHYYYVTDALSSGRVTWIDGYYAAMELAKVDSFTAIREITLARLTKARQSPLERLYAAVGIKPREAAS